MTKMTVLALFAAGVFIAAEAAQVLAQEPTVPRSPRAFGRIDANKDGSVTVQELLPRAERAFFRMDGDKNGDVSTAEIDLALQKIVVQRRKRILGAMDADGNGSISKPELERYVASLLKSADANGDGGVSLEEARSFRVAKGKKKRNGGD